MEWEIIKPDEQSVTTWSGGKTRALFLRPKTSSYKARNFRLRLSTATVTADESTFTQLPGYDRKLMVLTGQVQLQHDNKSVIKLSALETDEFAGDSITTSQGQCRDFNIMQAQTAGFTTAFKGYTKMPHVFFESNDEDFFYAVKGNFSFECANYTNFFFLNQGSVLHLKRASQRMICHTSKSHCCLIHVGLKKR